VRVCLGGLTHRKGNQSEKLVVCDGSEGSSCIQSRDL
jgi:hypothetical protein